MTDDPSKARWRRFSGGMAAAPFEASVATQSVRFSANAYEAGGGAVTANGDGGRVYFDGREVAIDRSGAASFIIHGLTGVMRFSIHDIQSVRVRRARGRAHGFLQFKLSGVDGAVRGGAEDKNSIIFNAAQQPEFQRLANLIRCAVRDAQEPVVVSGPGEFTETAELLTLNGMALASEEARPAQQGGAADRTARLHRLRSDGEGRETPRQTTAQALAAFVAHWTSYRRGPAS